MSNFELPLGIRQPEPVHGKNFMIHFATQGEGDYVETLTTAYNLAICEVMRKAKLNPFHQVGMHNAVGYHGWEALFTKTSEEAMNALLPEVKVLAQRLFKDLCGEDWKE